MSWTLESELIRLGGKGSVAEALVQLRLIERGESFQLTFQEDWRRAGAETYTCRFSVSTSGKPTKELIIKACVAYSAGGTLEGILEDWVARRKLLSEHGVRTPSLVFAGEGVIVEEYVPFPLFRFLKDSAGTTRLCLLRELGQLAATLVTLRFASQDPYSDLRTDGTGVFVVDFGSDLGPPGSSDGANGTLDPLWDALRAAEIELDTQELLLVRNSYDTQFKFGSDQQT